MGLSDVERWRKQSRSRESAFGEFVRGRRAGGGFRPTLAGDPELNKKEDSQAFASNAYAQTQMHSSQEAIARALEQPGLSDEDRDELLRIAKGEAPETRFESILDSISAFGRTVRLGMIDAAGYDEEGVDPALRPGLSAVSPVFGVINSLNPAEGDDVVGKREIEWKDYLNTFVGSSDVLKEELGEELVGERGDVSTSQLLKLQGWDTVRPTEEDDTVIEKLGLSGARAGRGVVSFVGDVVTDPLSWVTFGTGGAGKAAATTAGGAAMRQAGDDAVKTLLDDVAKGGFDEVARGVSDSADALTSRIIRESREAFADGAPKIADDLIAQRASAEGITDDLLAEFKGTLLADPNFTQEVVQQVVQKTTDRIGNRALKLVADGQWRTLADEIPEWAGSQVVPNFAKGGIRFTVDPTGLFRSADDVVAGGGILKANNVFRTPQAKDLYARTIGNAATLDRAFQGIGKLGRLSSKTALRQRMARQGKGMSLARMSEYTARILDDLGMDDRMTHDIQAAVARVSRLAESKEVPVEDAMKRLSSLLGSLDEGRRIQLDAIEDVELRDALSETHDLLRGKLDQVAAALHELTDGAFKKQEGYLPLIGTEDFVRDLRRAIIDDGLELPEDIPEHLETGYELLRQYAGNVLRGADNRGGVVLGHSAHMNQRNFGRTVAFPLGEAADLAMADPDWLRQVAGNADAGRVLSTSWLNEQMSEAFEHFLRHHGKPRFDGDVFEQNVAQVLDAYTSAMRSAVEMQATLKSAKELGLAKVNMWEIDSQRVLDRLRRDLSPARMQEMGALYDDLTRATSDAFTSSDPKVKRTVLRTGRGKGRADLEVELPESVANHPTVKQALKQYERRVRDLRKHAKQIARDERRLIDGMVKQGVPEDLARRLARDTTPEAVDRLQRDLLAAANDEARDLIDTARATIDEFYGRAAQRDEVLANAKAAASQLRRDVRKAIKELEGLRPVVDEVADAAPKVFEPTPEVLATIARRAGRSRATWDNLTPAAANALREHPLLNSLLTASSGDPYLTRALARNWHDMDSAMTEAFDALRERATVEVTDAFGADVWSALDSAPNRALVEFLMGGRGSWVDEALEATGIEETNVVSILNATAAERGLKNPDKFAADSRTWLQRKLRASFRELGIDWDFRTGSIEGLEIGPPTPTFETMSDAEIETWALDNWDEFSQMMAETFDIPASRVQFVEEGGGRILYQPEPTQVPSGGATVRQTIKALREVVDGGEDMTLRQLLNAYDGQPLPKGVDSTLQALQSDGIAGFEVERYMNLQETFANTFVRNPRGVRSTNADVAAAEKWGRVATEIEKLMDNPTPQRLGRLRKAWNDKDGARKALQKFLPPQEFQRFENTLGLIDLAYDSKVPQAWKDAAAATARQWEEIGSQPLQNPWDELVAAIDQVDQRSLSARQAAAGKLDRLRQRFVELNVRSGAIVDPVTGEVRLRSGARQFATPDFKERFNNFRKLAKETGKDLDALADEVLDGEIADALKAQSRFLRKVDVKLSSGKVPDGIRPDGFVDSSAFGIDFGAKAGSVSLDPAVGELLQSSIMNMAGLYRPEVLKRMIASGRMFSRYWKASVTVGRTIDFVGNNVLGGLWNASYRGVGPKDYQRIGLNTIRYRTGGRIGETFEEAISRVDPELQEVFREAVRVGVIGDSFAETDLRRIVDRSGTLTSKLLSPEALKFWNVDDFGLFQFGGWLMESSEDIMRLAQFAREYDRYGSATTAKALVDAIHFDYSDLTGIERSIQDFIPFYTWTRKNIPLQLRTLIEQPRVIARYAYLMSAVDENWEARVEDYEEWPVPYASGRAAVVGQIGEGAFASRLIFDPRLPVTDLGELFDNVASPTGWIEYVSNQMGPWVTLPFELQEQSEWGDVNAPIGLREALMFTNSVGITDRPVSQQGDVRIPRTVRSLMEAAFPMWTYTVERVAPTDPGRKQQLGYESPDPSVGDRLEGFGRRYLQGLGVKVSSPSQIDDIAYEERERVQKIMDDLKIEGAYQG